MVQANVARRVRWAGPKTSIIEIQGELNGSAEGALAGAFDEASGGEVRTVILEFSDLGYMNSSGIGLLVMLLIRANRQGQRLLACGLSEHYRDIFALTRLNEAIHIFATEAEALVAADSAR